MSQSRSKMLLLLVPLLATLALLWVGGIRNAQGAQDAKLVWSQVASPASVDLNNVFMVDASSAWAVGSHTATRKGVVYKLTLSFDAWHITYSQDLTRAANAISALPNGDVWVVGGGGLIARSRASDEGAWTEMESPMPSANLLTLQMLGEGEEGWAGGYVTVGEPGGTSYRAPVLLHYANGKWAQDTSIDGRGSIESLHFGQRGGWAVGSSEMGIWRYRPGSWSQEQEPAPCGENYGAGCFRDFFGVRTISADEAWAVGDHIGLCGICRQVPYVVHRINGSWQRVVPDQGIEGDDTPPGSGYQLNGVTFVSSDTGFAVGYRSLNPAYSTSGDPRPLILSYSGARWHLVKSPVEFGELNSVSAYDATHVLAAGKGGLIISYGYGQQPGPTPTATPSMAKSTPTPQPTTNPASRVPDPHDARVTYFPEVGHTLSGIFRAYWQQYGGLPPFGFPITEEFTEVSPTNGKTYVVQYFERNRFEYHPENKPPYDVLLGLLGNDVTASRRAEQPFQRTPPQAGGPGTFYFPETGHNLSPQFAQQWRLHGGLPVYGYPISEAFEEHSPTDGKVYLVQYFERNRFELHPELPEQYRVELGLLGVQVLKARGWIAR